MNPDKMSGFQFLQKNNLFIDALNFIFEFIFFIINVHVFDSFNMFKCYNGFYGKEAFDKD